MIRKLALLIILVLTISCSDQSDKGPVIIYYGEDICERCKMIISEKDFAAQYKMINGKAVKFDDLGCMIQYIHKNEKAPVPETYVVDYSSKQWIEGQRAYYVWTQNIHTPMGYGLLTFKERPNTEDQFFKGNSMYLGGQEEAYDWFLKVKSE